MSFKFPENPSEFLEYGLQFSAEVRQQKRIAALPGYGWYPYDSLSALSIVAELISPVFDEIAESIVDAPVADVGCADGDFAMLFARWGADVDAIDYAPNNFNRMRGVDALGRLLNLPIRTYSLDLDGRYDMPRENCGFTLFLGTLYHLKNPYYALEKLAFHTRWCVLSTRIAQVTPKTRARIDDEPVAYLADGREIADDATNFWIFSASGLLRILQRTRWAIAGVKRIGRQSDSDPIHPEADERMFVLLKSRVRYPELQVRPLDGWYEPEQDSWRWTAKRFSLEVVLPLEQPVAGFALSIGVPEGVGANTQSITVSCSIRGERVGSAAYEAPGPVEFAGKFPPFAAHEPILQVEFSVNSSLCVSSGDLRELGICVPLLDFAQKNTHRIPFRVF